MYCFNSYSDKTAENRFNFVVESTWDPLIFVFNLLLLKRKYFSRDFEIIIHLELFEIPMEKIQF